MKRFALLLVVSFLAGCTLHEAALLTNHDRIAPSPPPEKMPISFWCGPPDNFVTLDRFQEIADANFTLVMPSCNGDSIEKNRKRLEYCQQVGLKIMIQDPRMPLSLSAPDAKKNLDAIVADYSKYPALYGYFVTDEPASSAFPGLAQVVAYLKEKDPAHVAFINLFPNYAPLDVLGGKSYDDHVEQFIKIVKPFAVSYDHYHFKNNGDGPLFFKNLASVRKASLDGDVPFWNIVQCVHAFDWRKLTEAEKRWEAMQTLAYGGKGVLYFTYWQPGKEWGEAIIDLTGKRTRQYNEIKRINHDTQSIGQYLLHATSQSVTRIPTAATRPTTAMIARDDPSYTFGIFSDGNTHYALAANLNYRAQTNVQIEFPTTASIEHLDKRTGEWNPVKGSATETSTALDATLAAGDAELYRWQ